MEIERGNNLTPELFDEFLENSFAGNAMLQQS